MHQIMLDNKIKEILLSHLKSGDTHKGIYLSLKKIIEKGVSRELVVESLKKYFLEVQDSDTQEEEMVSETLNFFYHYCSEEWWL